MNRPSVAEGNWKWRLKPGALDPALEELLRQTTKSSGRDGQ
jgi:4-alpha-glucanotransferase